MRPGLVLLAAACLAAGEAEPPTLTFAAGSSVLSLSSDRPSESSGGVRIGYEAVKLACDRLAYRLAPLAGAPRPVLLSAELRGGPAGPEDGRVLFDSSASRLPQMAFRGVLRPQTVVISRLDPDPQRPQEVRFRAEAANLGDLHGVVETPAGPRQHVAWAERAVLEFAGTVDGGATLGLVMPRLTALHLYGRAAAGDVPARPAVVLRLAKPVPAAEAVAERLIAAGAYGMRAEGMTMSLFFDATGNLSGYQSDTGNYEMRDGEDLIPRLGGSAPILKP